MASDDIRIDLESARALGVLDRIGGYTSHTAPLMSAIAGIMLDEVEENFAQLGRPRWLGLARSTVEGRVDAHARKVKGGYLKSGRISSSVAARAASHRILQNSGRLAASITPASDAHQAIVGTNVVYAAIQHFGGKTRPHVIVPRHKRALAFGGHIVKRVNHPGSTIPARPFLVLGPTGEDRIVGAANAFLQTAIR